MSLPLWKASFLVALALTAASTAMLVWGPLPARVEARSGALAMERGRTSEAIEHLESSVAAQPTARTRYQLASAYLEAGRPGEAARAFELALSLSVDPELRRQILHNLALARLHEARGNPPGARTPSALASIVAGRAALRLDPASDGTRLNLALAERLVSRTGASNDPQSVRDTGGRPLTGGGSVESGGSLTPAQARTLLDALGSSETSDILEVLDRLFRDGGLSIRTRGPRW